MGFVPAHCSTKSLHRKNCLGGGGLCPPPTDSVYHHIRYQAQKAAGRRASQISMAEEESIRGRMSCVLEDRQGNRVSSCNLGDNKKKIKCKKLWQKEAGSK